MPTLKRPSLIVAAVVAAFLVLSACGGSDAKDEGVPVPKGFDVPDGVTLTAGGTTLTEDESASVVYQVGTSAASAITVTVTQVAKGTIDDFKFFSLDEASKQASPFYVSVTVKNEGPAGLGGAALPIYAHDDSNTIFPPNELVGNFPPCPTPSLPATFLPGSEAKLCLVYLVPKGKALQSVDLQTGSAKDAITWTP
ncbi:hypothetical protein [Aeromicrobium panaciterrae]|uniref:hypothetical protein n=1 Tax=Aeromicrobium panaciterrae TaxID=363861 RepID=UPI0031D69F63